MYIEKKKTPIRGEYVVTKCASQNHRKQVSVQDAHDQQRGIRFQPDNQPIDIDFGKKITLANQGGVFAIS
jgi:hypothetical protein